MVLEAVVVVIFGVSMGHFCCLSDLNLSNNIRQFSNTLLQMMYILLSTVKLKYNESLL